MTFYTSILGATSILLHDVTVLQDKCGSLRFPSDGGKVAACPS